MKSLQTIQKTCRVFQILTKVAMILSFVWAGLMALVVVCAMVWKGGITIFGMDRELLYTLTETGGLNELAAKLLPSIVFALTDGTLLAFAYRYLKAEQADGTPFTRTGAVKIRQLGISTIVMPIVATIVSAVIYGCFQAVDTANSAIYAAVDYGDDLPTFLVGIVLILVSLIFNYGAELEENRHAS
ncbi:MULTISPECIES: hypothetical protein [unclassified Ruminococcus]|uniref:hypothetical protein n=1 Tax=unclassified Ruminococcus TaxID=2608920 RepID=UPI002108B7FD|nr:MULTISPECIES: hypothetical protein [unclassified Ruminococcus]MCQ4022382.1 hypothetical protein [Ruminococcus sp. zg-924]MCQ4114710.1 hypothetical protein [Ruminococcus sp. zg-921]